MSDWLKDARNDRNEFNARNEKLEALRASTYRDLDHRVRNILLEAIVFLNEQPRTYRRYRIDPSGEQYFTWSIDTDDGPDVFSLRVSLDIQKSLEDNPGLVVNTYSGKPAFEIRVSEFSEDWLKTQVLETVRSNTPRLPD